MAITRLERKLLAVSPQAFTADGTANGVVKVANACLFRHRQDVIIRANLLDPIKAEIKEIFDETTILVGPSSYSLKDRVDISAYTTALAATIEAPRQAIKAIDAQEINLAAFERAPVAAHRFIPVDNCGNLNDASHPVFVSGSLTIGGLVTPTFFAKSAPTKDTEVSQALPSNTEKFQFKIRPKSGGSADAIIKYAFAAGEIAAGRFWTVEPGNTERQSGLSLAISVLHFTTSKDNAVIEILAWQ